MCNLFENKSRSYEGSVERGETLFNYYDRSATEHAAHVRSLINHWVKIVPEPLREKILAIKNQNQNQFYDHDKKFVSVIYEAYLYNLLLGLEISANQIEYEKMHPMVIILSFL